MMRATRGVPTRCGRKRLNTPNAECRPVQSIWGHMALWNPEDRPFFDAALRELLG